MDTIKPLFTTTATATGGRDGHTQANDGSVSADLSVPKATGGPGRPHPSQRFRPPVAVAVAVKSGLIVSMRFLQRDEHSPARKTGRAQF